MATEKNEFPAWFEHGEHLEKLCQKPHTAATGRWKCSESTMNRIVIREHLEERIKQYVSPDVDVSHRPTMTFAWHQPGYFQVIYKRNWHLLRLVSQSMNGAWV